MDLEELRLITREAWVFDERNYPSLNKLSSEEDKKTFALNHILSHLVKTIGQVALTIEPLNHGDSLNGSELRIALRKLILEVVQCADVADIRMTDLEEEIRGWYSAERRRGLA